MVNNAHLVEHLARQLESTESDPMLLYRERLPADPMLLARLPTSAFIQREAEILAPKAIIKQLRRSPSPSPPSSPKEDETASESTVTPESEEVPPERTRTKSFSSVLSSVSLSSPKLSRIMSVRQSSGASSNSKAWKEPEPFEIFRAVEKKDIMFLMEVRDRAFHLLLRKHGDATPLLHCMRIGKSHQDVAIILLGAFSRYINNLQDEEFSQPRTRMLLKALRVNLRLAIDLGLQTQQSDLIASFLQTLIMSEGGQWVSDEAGDIAAALRLGTEGKPVKTANDAVRRFATRELGKAPLIASFEDYVANATADLVMMGAWQLVLEVIEGESIPVWYFARDDRVYKCFVDRLDKHKDEIRRRLGRRLRWQLRVLRTVLDGRAKSFEGKVKELAEEFDQGEGV